MGGIAFLLAAILVILDRYLASYGDCDITINDSKTLTVTGGQSLLSYLMDNKIFIPSACGGRATCGFCKVNIPEGAGPLLPTESPFLTRSEVARNTRLACQVKVKSDLSVIIPEKYLSIQEFKTIVESIKDLNYDTKEIFLRLDEPEYISFMPGQYIQLKLPDSDEYRAYSIASPPDSNNFIELIVRLVPGGCCSGYIHRDLKTGHKVSFTGPYGELALRENSDKDIICVGGGCGMAPFRSIIRHLFDTGTKRDVKYFYGARSVRDLYFVDEFRKLEREKENFSFIIALSEPDKDSQWEGEIGFIHQILDKHLQDNNNAEAYLCGPPVMIDMTMQVLLSKGIAEEDIMFDKIQ
ncbi:2Fe-2S iron-sulfur cluster binding domain-containing protein [Candidatus Poribacteria bacterium]|nr:2Fe-2S iron-sulfur cluster binding domain-containing protein [Candidatus Poribacteria bacterium]